MSDNEKFFKLKRDKEIENLKRREKSIETMIKREKVHNAIEKIKHATDLSFMSEGHLK